MSSHASSSRSPTEPVRRSGRLAPNPETRSSTVVVEIAPRRSNKRQRREATESDDGPCLAAVIQAASASTPTPTPPKRRGRPPASSKRENELQSLLNEVQISLASEKWEKQQLQHQLQYCSTNQTLNQLIQHFSCALCLEVVANPYNLNNIHCGHTFCALCVLKFFFAGVHTACGYWHASVHCPLCRAKLLITPDRVPRHLSLIPFAPNRLAQAVVHDALERLAAHGAVREWALDGSLRLEWMHRDAEGRREMEYLSEKWETMSALDFLSIKARLRV